MPTIPAQPSWHGAPLTITLVCEDRQAPDCRGGAGAAAGQQHGQVTVHVTAEDAARVRRGRPIGAARAFLEAAMPAQAPGREYTYPLAPPNRLSSDGRVVCCPACLEDIAEAYHRPRPPAPAVPEGSVAWWEGCRRFRCGQGLPAGGVALERGRWVVLTEQKA